MNEYISLFSDCFSMLKRKLRKDVSKKINLAGGSVCTNPQEGTSLCIGDSGGPLVDSKRLFIGIVSWGIIPCGKGPDMYTNVGYYADWLHSVIPELKNPEESHN